MTGQRDLDGAEAWRDLATVLRGEWGAFDDVEPAVDPVRIYRSYAKELASCLDAGASEREVSEYLTREREKAMDAPDAARDATAARAVIAWRESR